MSLTISVVTPSFNQAQFLAETMSSIHDQGFEGLEHIVMDGGSTDGSVDIIEQYSDRLAHWVSQRDEGQTDALIRGFDRSSGDIQCWLNSDDLFEPGTLEEVADFFEQRPDVDFIYGDSTWIDEYGRVVKHQREHGFSEFIWLYAHNYIPQPSAFWRRSLYDEVGGLNGEFDLAMDADLWIRFAQLTRPRHVRRTWSKARIYAEQKNTRLRKRSIEEHTSLRERYQGVEPRWVVNLKSRLARTAHVSRKLVTGRYTVAETRLHLKGLAHGGWESKELSSRDGD